MARGPKWSGIALRTAGRGWRKPASQPARRSSGRMAGERNSPQTLCLGKADFSKIRTGAPSRMAANAAITPAGPPPTTWTARIGAPPECHYTERMQRSFEEEILDVGGLAPEVLERAHRRLSQTHSLLGNHAAILRALRCDGAARRVLDIGCGHGGVLEESAAANGGGGAGCGSAAAARWRGGVSDSEAGRRAGGSTAGRRGRERMPGSSPARRGVCRDDPECRAGLPDRK